jgi:elongation factor 1-alpha
MSSSSESKTKQHMSVVVAGHVDSGKSTTVGHLLFQLGNISQRDLDKMKEEAKAMGKDSFSFAFFLDTQKAERERGITISCTTKEFNTPNYHYTVIDAPGHRDFIKNMMTGSSQADVGILMVPADGGFGVAIQKGNKKSGEIQGQTRQHARLLLLLGVKQLIICVNKMDSDTAKYSQERFNEVADEMRNMLVSVGWNKDTVKNSVPVLPISGWKGDNLFEQSKNMPWWKGVDVKSDKDSAPVTVITLHDALDKFAKLPKRNVDGPLRIPVSGVHNIKGVGVVITGRVEQGTARPGQEVRFIPSYESVKSEGKIFTIEMHHKTVAEAGPGDNVGLNIKGLTKENMPKIGDIIVLAKDDSLRSVQNFTCQVQVLDPPNTLKAGSYTPVGFCRTATSPLKFVKVNWKMGKSTNNQKVTDATELAAGDMAEVVFEPQKPFVVEKFSSLESLGRIACFEGNGVIMLGKVSDVVYKQV